MQDSDYAKLGGRCRACMIDMTAVIRWSTMGKLPVAVGLVSRCIFLTSPGVKVLLLL